MSRREGTLEGRRGSKREGGDQGGEEGIKEGRRGSRREGGVQGGKEGINDKGVRMVKLRLEEMGLMRPQGRKG